MKIRFRIVCALLLLMIVPRTWAENSCSAAVDENAVKAKAIQRELLAIKVEEMDPKIPPPVRMKIVKFKDALAATVDAAMKCETAAADPKKIENGLAKKLDANQPEKPFQRIKSPISTGIYGAELTVSVRRSADTSELIQVEAHFGIECSYDSILLIYERKYGLWNRVLRWQSKEYAQISGAFGDFFDSVILPQSGPSGSMLVVVVHGTPWCTSRFSMFKIDVLQPGEDRPRVLFETSEGYSRGNIGSSLKATRDGFELRIERSSMDLTGVFTRIGIFRYRVKEGHVERVQPIALNGRDFVDEWLQTEWKDASRWCAPDALQELQQVQQSLKTETSAHLHYGAVRACSGDSKHFQVELRNESGKTLYFQIRSGHNSFTMLSVSESADSRCTGVDIMKKRGGAYK